MPWGSSFIVNKLLMNEMGPATLSLYRWLLATAIFTGFLFATRRHRTAAHLLRHQPGIFLVLGILCLPIPYLAQNFALQRTSVINVSVLMDSDPVFIVILSALLLRERVTWIQSVGVFIALLGTVAITANAGPLGLASSDLVGNLLALCAACSWAVYTILTKVAAREHDYLMLSILPTLLGTVFLVPPALLEGLTWPSNPWIWLGVLFLGIVCSAWATMAWVRVLNELDASRAAPFIFLIPVVATALSVTLLHERLTAPTAFGAILILGGVFLSERNGVRKQASQPVKVGEQV